jgi:hypothetical protein
VKLHYQVLLGTGFAQFLLNSKKKTNKKPGCIEVRHISVRATQPNNKKGPKKKKRLSYPTNVRSTKLGLPGAAMIQTRKLI